LDCNPGDTWADGWIIFSDSPLSGAEGSVDGADFIITRHEALFNVTFSGGTLPNRLTYRANGRAKQTGTFDLTSDSATNTITIGPTGRPNYSDT
jgi:hypothetical protein